MLAKTKGIVLNRRKYSDNSLIVKIFTRQCGVVSFIVKNAFSKKSKVTQAFFAPLNLLELTFNYKDAASLLYFKDVSFYKYYEKIPFDLAKNTILLFYNELLYRLLYDYGADERLYDFLESALVDLDECNSLRPDAHIFFLVALSRELGFFPHNNFSATQPYFSVDDGAFSALPYPDSEGLDEEASRYLSQVIDSVVFDNGAVSSVVPPKQVRDTVLDILLVYFARHNEHLYGVNSVEIFRRLGGGVR